MAQPVIVSSTVSNFVLAEAENPDAVMEIVKKDLEYGLGEEALKKAEMSRRQHSALDSTVIGAEVFILSPKEYYDMLNNIKELQRMVMECQRTQLLL